jgi:hypothetical protein
VPLPDDLRFWTAVHPDIGWTVSSYAIVSAGVLINPLLPGGDDEAIDDVDVRAILLTNRHHVRDSERLASHGVTIRAPAAGLWDLEGVTPPVSGYRDGDQLPGEVVAHEVGVLSPDEFALHSENLRFLAVADGVMRDGDGPLRPMPDGLLGDDPAAVKAGLAAAYLKLSDELEFDHLLLAHGLPVVDGGRTELRAYAKRLPHRGPE